LIFIENGLLRRIFALRREKVTEVFRKMCTEKLHNLVQTLLNDEFKEKEKTRTSQCVEKLEMRTIFYPET
jgi:hypothetical protein